MPPQVAHLNPQAALAALLGEDTARFTKPLRFFIDGYNVMLRRYGEGRKKRDDFQKDFQEFLRGTAGLRKRMGEDCEMVVFLDGDETATKTSIYDSRLQIRYSGGAGSHRADYQIVSCMELAMKTGGAERLIVVSNDKEIREAAINARADLLTTEEFSEL